MSNFIKTVDAYDAKLVLERGKWTESVRSISINQASGDFFVTSADISNSAIIVYPQSQSNPDATLLGNRVALTGFSGFGALANPLDARIDTSNGKLWIADSGNLRILKVDAYSFLAEYAINSILNPHALAPNPNTGGIFIKASFDNSYGMVYYYSSTGLLQSSFKYLDNNSNDAIALPSTLGFDHRRSRLWWTALDKVYMADFLNNQVVKFDLSSESAVFIRGLDVHLDSGNAFVAAKLANGAWVMAQLFRDNNRLLDYAYLPTFSQTEC